jgi:hypothetical protein
MTAIFLKYRNSPYEKKQTGNSNASPDGQCWPVASFLGSLLQKMNGYRKDVKHPGKMSVSLCLCTAQSGIQSLRPPVPRSTKACNGSDVISWPMRRTNPMSQPRRREIRSRGDSLKMTALWDIAPCSLVEVDRRFGSVYCLHQQSLVPLAFHASESQRIRN